MHRKTHPKEIRTSKAIPLARKLLSLVLSLLLFGNLSLTARATVVTSGYTNYSHYFWDVKSSDWYYSAVQYVNFVGYMKGVSDNRFNPNATLTKAEIITTLFRFTGQIALTSDFDENNPPYDDVTDEDDYFSVPVAWAKSKNLAQVIQKDSTHFGPHTTIQRIQIAKLIYKFAKSQGWGGTMPSVSLPYTDISNIKDSTSRQALKWCYYNKVMTGVGDKKFNPNGTVTRAEFAKILQNLDTTVTPAFYTPVCKTKAFCVGTKYENQFFNHVDTTEAAKTAAKCFRKLNYSTLCVTQPTQNHLLDFYNLRSNIIVLIGHGDYDNVKFNYMQKGGERLTGVSYEDKDKFKAYGYKMGIIKGKMGLVDLIVFCACDTANTENGTNLAKEAAKYGAKVSIGWKKTIQNSGSMCNWLECFHEALSDGNSVYTSLIKADDHIYLWGSNVCDWSVYCSNNTNQLYSSLKLSDKAASSEITALNTAASETGNLLKQYTGSTQVSAANPGDGVAAILQQADPRFDPKDYRLQVYDHGELGSTVHFVRLIGDFETDTGYTAFVHNGKVVSLRDHTRPISAEVEAKACSVSRQQTVLPQSETTCNPAAVSGKTAELTEALRLGREQTEGCPEKKVDRQRYAYFYDLERDQPCILVYTDYHLDGTNAKGSDLYIHDLKGELDK